MNSLTNHFLGYSSSENTWEPEEHVDNCQEIVQAFLDEQAKRKRSRYSDSDSNSDSSQSRAHQRMTRSSIRQQQTSTDSSSMNDDDGYVTRRSSSKRLRENPIDIESMSSVNSQDSDILDMAKLDQILDVRRNKKTYQVQYNIRLKKITKSVWVNSDQLIEDYAQQVVDFLEEEYV